MVEQADDADTYDRLVNEMNMRNMRRLKEWVVDADFSKEDLDLVKLAQHPFHLSEEEEKRLPEIEHLVKVVKILAYKIGIVSKRQDFQFGELATKVEAVKRELLLKHESELQSVNQTLQ